MVGFHIDPFFGIVLVFASAPPEARPFLL
jgi:hypothetical protein